ncbi:MAG: hypothetical protein JSV80_14355 [Acidobacteriota bacterium]|nr:MAG: hypothetical protein JSV80_14355 [Acidobacteriota bacterium]
MPKKLARELAHARGEQRTALERLVEREASGTIAKMRSKGYELAARLETGEGVFVREDDVVGLHIQLPTALYRRLDDECQRRAATKRKLVIEALERYLGD